MSVGMDAVRERMAEYLTGQGVAAVTAWPPEERQALEGPVAVVSLRGCRAEPGGFQNYLGERYNQEKGMWEELYGQRVTLTFGLDLYAPARGDGAELQGAFDALTQALTLGGPQGLPVQEFSCGETEYDAGARLRKRSVQAVCRAFLRAVEGTEDVFFTDFELRGGLQQ